MPHVSRSVLEHHIVCNLSSSHVAAALILDYVPQTFAAASKSGHCQAARKRLPS